MTIKNDPLAGPSLLSGNTVLIAGCGTPEEIDIQIAALAKMRAWRGKKSELQVAALEMKEALQARPRNVVGEIFFPKSPSRPEAGD